MRFVVRNYRVKPAKLKETAVITEWETISLTANKVLIKNQNYADPYDTSKGRRSRVIDVLDTWYFGKCAYCEKGCKADVEHYRPAKAVKDLNNVDIPGHNGYYWLCYEWSNMLPACSNCNREGAKHSIFTTFNSYQIVPSLKRNGSLNKGRCRISNSYLTVEQPVLLNPEIDNPNNYFDFDIDPNNDGIIIVGKDINNRGRDTIDICLLNRYELVTQRHNLVVLDFVESIHSSFISRKKGIIDDNELKTEINQLFRSLYNKSLNNRIPFTLLRQYIVASPNNFKKIIIPYIEKPLQNTVITAFLNYVHH